MGEKIAYGIYWTRTREDRSGFLGIRKRNTVETRPIGSITEGEKKPLNLPVAASWPDQHPEVATVSVNGGLLRIEPKGQVVVDYSLDEYVDVYLEKNRHEPYEWTRGSFLVTRGNVTLYGWKNLRGVSALTDAGNRIDIQRIKEPGNRVTTAMEARV